MLPEARFVDLADLDLTRRDLLAAALEDMCPEAIVNCAAYTAVDRAEQEEALASRVNGAAVGVMAEHAARRRIPLLTFSTDYVFAGDAAEPYLESSPTDPINAYGRSKLAGERAALAACPGALVVRTSWLVSGTHPNFVATMLRLAGEGVVRVVDDQRGCPTMADDLAPAAWAALRSGATGILHLTNSGEATWFEFARAAVAAAGLDPGRIVPCATADYPTPARRPAYSVLGSERRRPLGLAEPPAWRESLPAVVGRLRR
ncbi:MAG: dTDP-4-dehydrorhamnose reductase [Acidobacteria bacterium]|nr:dTDP-4-dehydrorhamnose reductase [Acidobacteriota bacterium]